ncbi:tail terminator [Gordonia phage Archimedes]|uniref:Tail terminator n=1 Tax=Gordonia phage Archimedes TaxID=2759389 RepID=A0A7L7SHY1_9CAUD|nr:tail terminator [Gordonia phage Archimedes]QOC55710.1 tail terminator [Gordonia phage Archimedes]
MAEYDVTKEVADALVALLTGWTIDTKVPADIPTVRLPLATLTEQPGSESFKPWNHSTGPLSEIASIDIDLFGSSVLELKQTARAVSRMLYSMVSKSNRITEVYCPATFAVRPDWNDRISRVGAEFDFTFRP